MENTRRARCNYSISNSNGNTSEALDVLIRHFRRLIFFASFPNTSY